MPAAGSFKAEKGAAGEVGFGLCLPAFGREAYSVLGQDTFHFPKVGFTVVAEIFADMLRRCPQQHCKDCLTALKVGGFMDIIDVHFSYSCQKYHLYFIT